MFKQFSLKFQIPDYVRALLCAFTIRLIFGGTSILICVTVIASFIVSMCTYLIASAWSNLTLFRHINQMATEQIWNAIEFNRTFSQFIRYHNKINEIIELRNSIKFALIVSRFAVVVFFFFAKWLRM